MIKTTGTSGLQRRGRHALAMAVVLALVPWVAQAQSSSAMVDGFPVWATQNTALTGFKVTVTDLAPADGVAPSVVFDPSTQADGGLSTWSMGYDSFGDTQHLASQGFQLPDTHVSSGNGVADITLNQGNVQLTTQSRMGLEEQHVGWGHLPADGPRAIVNNSQTFTLGAHTAVTISGVFTADMALNLSAFRAYKGEQIPLAVTSFGPIASLELQFKGGDAQLQNAWLPTTAGVDQPDMLKLLDSNVDKGLDWSLPQHFETPFTLTLRNDSDVAREAQSRLYIAADSFYEFGWIPASVPEPSTYVLTGMGLVGVIAAAKRRRQAV